MVCPVCITSAVVSASPYIAIGMSGIVAFRHRMQVTTKPIYILQPGRVGSYSTSRVSFIREDGKGK